MHRMSTPPQYRQNPHHDLGQQHPQTWPTCRECADEATTWHYEHNIEIRYHPWPKTP
jgi:hypothetical protein